MKLDNKNIFCSVSAGYSSVMMATKMKEWYPDHNIIFGMANTSKEREESLEFMDQCDKHFGLDLVWIEAEFHERGVGVTYNIVDFKDLKRNGEIFESGIKKFGIPSKANPWCNRDMKKEPMRKFCDDIFGRGNYSIAVGYRVDEIDRITKDYKTNDIFYPLIDKKISSRDRNKFWKDQPIQIKIKAYEGNCTKCWKKSNRKLLTLIDDEKRIEKKLKDIQKNYEPEWKWWAEMEEKYGQIPIEGKPAYNSYAENVGMNFYRENRSMMDLVEMAKKPFKRATDEYIYENDLFDQEGDCGQSCEAF